ncbi:MAG: biotin-dependent carboxyltransferase family protein [Devosia sp.]|nr:biotin-dependent carboxyltransferase family protein [Devosia sp.]
MTAIVLTRAGPLTTLQDAGRFGMLAHGVSASGPMDRGAYLMAGAALERAGETAIEFSQGLEFDADGDLLFAVAGGDFKLWINGAVAAWPVAATLKSGDHVAVAPGAWGNYGYLRFDREIDVPPVLGSRSTNVTVGLGGFKGRALKAGDRLGFGAMGEPVAQVDALTGAGPVRVIWGLHADLFDNAVRRRLVEQGFFVSTNLDRMGVRLTDPAGVFDGQRKLNLVSDAIVPGDIQILGDGTPIVLMRDHQPTGGYPRIATVVSADFDRLAQLRPGTEVRFRPVTLEHAR